MPYDYLELGPAEHQVAQLTLQRTKKKNALSMKMRDEIEDALGRLAQDETVRAVVLAGGDGIFCAGYDLKEGMSSGGQAFLHRFREFYEACYLFPKPVVAAVDGPALAGGFDLALMAEFIVASHRARFGHPEIGFGPVAITPIARFLAPAQIRELCFFADEIDAEKAQALGLIRELVEPAETLPAATKLARRLAQLPATAAVGTKRALATGTRDRIAADEAVLRATLDGSLATFEGYVSARLGPKPEAAK